MQNVCEMHVERMWNVHGTHVKLFMLGTRVKRMWKACGTSVERI
jgi:hypothetical protein